jgi:RNA polymerase sigma-70 factor (ECF subfamily)
MLRLRKPPTSQETFEDLIQVHLDGLYGAALRYTRQPQAAEDLVHDTVVRALRFKESFEMGTNFKAWIYTILTNTFIHKYRRSQREREILNGTTRRDVESRLHSEESREAAHNPENSYLRDMLSDDVLAALDDLPEDYRTVIVLCDLEGLSYKQIAEAIDRPVGTVMSRLYCGRRTLETKLRGLAKERGIIKGDSESDSESDKVLDMNRFRRRREA